MINKDATILAIVWAIILIGLIACGIGMGLGY